MMTEQHDYNNMTLNMFKGSGIKIEEHIYITLIIVSPSQTSERIREFPE